MGLGLDVCLSARAGRLCATNSVESGLTFQFTLPINSEGFSLARAPVKACQRKSTRTAAARLRKARRYLVTDQGRRDA
jgi:hypothetical protein